MDENEKGTSWYIKWLWGWYCSLSQTHDDMTWWIMTIPDELICAIVHFYLIWIFRSSDTVQQLLICHLTILAQRSSTRDSAEPGHLVTQHSWLGWSISPIGPLCSDSQGLWSMEATKNCFSHLILQMNKTSAANNKMGTRLLSVFAPAKSGWCYGPYHHPDFPETNRDMFLLVRTTIANQRPAPDLLDIRLAGGVALLHIKNHCCPAPFNSRIGCDIGLAGSCSFDFATRSWQPYSGIVHEHATSYCHQILMAILLHVAIAHAVWSSEQEGYL